MTRSEGWLLDDEVDGDGDGDRGSSVGCEDGGCKATDCEGVTVGMAVGRIEGLATLKKLLSTVGVAVWLAAAVGLEM